MYYFLCFEFHNSAFVCEGYNCLMISQCSFRPETSLVGTTVMGHQIQAWGLSSQSFYGLEPFRLLSLAVALVTDTWPAKQPVHSERKYRMKLQCLFFTH